MQYINTTQNGVVQQSLPDLAVQQMVSIGNDIRNLNQNVMANSQHMVDLVHAEIERGERERRKHRKKEISCWVAVVNDNFVLVKLFDDNTKIATNFTLNLIPDFETYRFKLKGLDNGVKFAGVHFKTADFWIVEEMTKITGQRLYEKMIQNEVIFNGGIPKSKIQDSLYEFFIPRIGQAGIVEIPALAGWFRKEFLSAETFWLRENEGLMDLPVRGKSFPNFEETPLCPEKYFQEIRNIKDWKNRLWVMLYPVSGMLSSLLWESRIKPEKCLNFVIISDMPMNRMRYYLQVFNRNWQMDKIVCREDILHLKDEVIILDSYSDYGESQYKRNQKVQAFQAFADGLIKGDFITEDGLVITSPAVIFSDQIMRRKSAVNIFVDVDFFEHGSDGEWVRQEEDGIGNFLFHLVRFCENKFDGIKKIMALEEDANSEVVWLRIVYKICQEFWEGCGIDMQKMAGLPESFDLGKLVWDDLIFGDDLIADFIKIVRTEIKAWDVREKNEGKGDGWEVLYDDVFVWIPVKVINEMFSHYGIYNQRYHFLQKLKDVKFLLTDDIGLSRKTQVAGNRYEAYQFRRALFRVPGMVDIVELGKEEQDVER